MYLVIAVMALAAVIVATTFIAARWQPAGEKKRSRALTEFLPSAIIGILVGFTVAIAMRVPIPEFRWLPVIAGSAAFCLSYVAVKLWWRGRDDQLRFGLRTLLALLLLVGMPLATFSYLRDWRMHRPPYQDYDWRQYQAAYIELIERLEAGQIDAAYDATSNDFHRHMSRQQFHDLFRRYPELLGRKPNRLIHSGGGGLSGGLHNSQNHVLVYQAPTPDSRRVGMWIWVVMRDSLLHHRPPLPQVEEIAIQEVDSWPHVTHWPAPTWPAW